MSEWKPIETCPKDGTYVLIGRADEEIMIDQPFEIDHWYSLPQFKWEDVGENLFRKVPDTPFEGWSACNHHRATHWMELPPMPIKAPKDE